MSAWVIWWVLALILIGIEMLSGTFYLLAIAVAFIAGGLVDFLGGSFLVQFVTTGVLGSAGCFIAYYYQQANKEKRQTQIEFDLGQRVLVLKWNDDGSARVSYRGSQWNAIAATPQTPRNKEMVIVRVQGSTLVLDTSQEASP